MEVRERETLRWPPSRAPPTAHRRSRHTPRSTAAAADPPVSYQLHRVITVSHVLYSRPLLTSHRTATRDTVHTRDAQCPRCPVGMDSAHHSSAASATPAQRGCMRE